MMMDPEYTLSEFGAGETLVTLPEGYRWLGVRGGAFIFQHEASGETGCFSNCQRTVTPFDQWQSAVDYQIAKLERRLSK
jgi:hypothetical protein